MALVTFSRVSLFKSRGSAIISQVFFIDLPLIVMTGHGADLTTLLALEPINFFLISFGVPSVPIIIRLAPSDSAISVISSYIFPEDTKHFTLDTPSQ